MSRIEGCTALVTGGASGIGRLMARGFLEKGARRLIIWDRDGEALDRAARELDPAAALQSRVHPVQVDVTDLDAVRRSVAELGEAELEVDILVNNAGVVVGREFAEHAHDDIRRTMEVNTMAPMHLALELLPGMVERRRGHIVNIASAAGLVSNPKMSVYCGSKWAMVGWSDALRIELERDGAGVRVTTVLPYYISTGMFDGVRSPLIPILTPEKVARAVVSAVEKDRIFLHLPWIVRLVPLLRGLLPARLFDRVVGDGLGVYGTMRGFRGRGGGQGA